MSQSSDNSSLLRALSVAGWFVIVCAGLKAAQAIVVPFILSVFIAIVLAPAFFWLQSRKLSEGLALGILMIAVVVGGGTIAAFVGASLAGFSQELPYYQSRLMENFSDVFIALHNRGLKIDSSMILGRFDPGAAMSMAAAFLSELSGVFANAFLILLAVAFMLLEASNFPRKLQRAFGGQAPSADSLDRFTKSVKNYMAIKTGTSLLTAVCISIVLAVLGVDFPILWGIFAFLLNYVPNLGSIIAAIPPVLLALVEHGVGFCIATIVTLSLVNVIIGNVIEPRLMGKGLGLSTFVVFVSLIFWGWVLGLVGMLLSVPLTMTLKLALESKKDTRWLAVLLGSDDGRDGVAA